ncbi:hypothetical protein Q428_09730 [Fervidicella metallireducens AeB]|uniref:Uncharacterized protein n=1 Tax=Fervidicella metallireducens AeB TaxID=1403537 RepID=A0A017RTP3_9CLOT|nr:hypothetical protein [Fervidicella metallireducens]EYE88103.1 hypothetical protein Q428_09730 [Fervidicella metallireducens AeB]
MVKSEIYLYALSAYVHNNPCDIKGYENCPEKYEFSSLSIYLGLRHDPYELVEDGFIMSMFSKNPKMARESYMRLVYKCGDKVFKEEVEFLNEGTEYRSGRKILVRNIKTKEILEFIASKMGIEKIKLHTKHCRDIVNAKALAVLLMRSLCNLKCKVGDGKEVILQRFYTENPNPTRDGKLYEFDARNYGDYKTQDGGRHEYYHYVFDWNYALTFEVENNKIKKITFLEMIM